MRAPISEYGRVSYIGPVQIHPINLRPLLIIAGLAASLTASAQIINFEADTAGMKPNGWSSVSDSFVTFTDTSGADLQIGNWNHQSDGIGLGVWGDDSSALKINFAAPINFLSLAFGNDDSRFSKEGDLAKLTLFLGGSEVGSTWTAMNRNDLMDQTLNFGAIDFDSAIFQYVDVNGAGINLIEIVDNIQYNGGAVPEPSTYGLIGAGALLGLAALRRYRNAKR